MDAANQVVAVQEMYAAFERGDIATITTKLTEDVKWSVHLDPSIPWSGDFSSRTRVPDFFNAIYANVDVVEFEPCEYVAQGDTVVSTGTFTCRVHATGKTANMPWVFVWKFRDDKVLSYEQFAAPGLAEAFAE
jgi:ketosteroid isomerase-like protein